MKTVCSKSWTDVNVDFANRLVRNCCMSADYPIPDTLTTDFFDNSPHVQQRRRSTLAGEQHPDCEYCWADERAGRNSYRSWMNQYHDFQNLSANQSDVRYIDVTLDTVCDLSCLYCAADASSQIAQEENKPIRDAGTDADFETFKAWLSTLQGSVVFNFLGGEPTASKRFAPMVEYISTLDLDVRIELCTNGNTKPSLMKRLFDVIENSDMSWGVALSNETIGLDSELLRYGLNWRRFEQNFIQYAQHPKIQHITLAATVNAFSIRGFPEYISWVHRTMNEYAPDKTFGWVGNYIKRPRAMDIQYLPQVDRHYIVAAQKVFCSFDWQEAVKNRDKFKHFLQTMHDRIGSASPENKLEDFILQKQRVKKKDLSKLL
jgi:organic radical activating enzyme